MNKFAQLAADITKLWTKYGSAYLSGIENTLILALVGTVIGCLIGFVCGILNTIPRRQNDHPLKKLILTLVRVIRGEVYLRLGGRHRRRVHQYRRLHGRIGPRRHHFR